MRRMLPLILAGLISLTLADASEAIQIGQPAPTLTITDWVKGKPMDVLKDGKGKVIVLEFWATWCPPCIQLIPATTELYQKYKGAGLIVVGVTDAGRGQQLSTVRDFVNRQGDKMDYPVAFDSTMQSTMTYGAYGLPHAVVIGKDGNVVWSGHPGMPQMKQVVVDLLNDRYDVKAAAEEAAKQARLERLINEFYLAANAGNWDEALAATDRMLDVDPASYEAMQYKIVVLVEELQSIERLRQWVKSFMQSHQDNAEALAKIGHLMLQLPNMPQRQPDLAVQAAKMAYAADPDTWQIVQAVAQIYFEIGDVDTAIQYQQRATEVAGEADSAEAKAILDYFEQCKSLKDPSHGTR